MIQKEIFFDTLIKKHIEYLKYTCSIFKPQLLNIPEILIECVKNNNTIFVCGNGGSAADSQHFVAELIGRFAKERKAIPAIALTTDTSILTAIANDYSFDNIFSRQIEGLGKENDILIAISTSGNSQNIINALIKAKEKKMITIGLTGSSGGKMKDLVDHLLPVPCSETYLIQEIHEVILHYFARCIENEVVK